MLCTKIMFSLLLTKSMTVLEEWLQVKERKNWIIKGTLVNVVHYLPTFHYLLPTSQLSVLY